MSKIEFDASKVRMDSAAARRSEESKRIYEKYKEHLSGEFIMDEGTKAAIDDLLKTIKRGVRPAPYTASKSPYSEYAVRTDEERRAEAERDRAIRDRIIREREERYERDRREDAEREARAELARKEHLERMEAERIRAEAEEKIRKETEKHREHFAQLAQPPRMYDRDELRTHTAALSVNSAKACVVLRAMMCKDLVDQIEREVHSSKRMWNGLDGVWEFHPSAMTQVRSILSLYFRDTQVVGVPKAIPSTKFDQLMAKLTKEDKSKIYRLLAGIYHPDKGGHNDVMVLINAVFKEK